MSRHAALALGLVACGGLIDPQATGAGSSASREGPGDDEQTSAPSTSSPPPLQTGIPVGPARTPGATGTVPCNPLEPTSPVKPTKLTGAPVIVGQSWNIMPYIVDTDPQRPGEYRAFIGHRGVMERHAVSADKATPGRFIIDRGMPNQIAITSATLEGGAADGPLRPVQDGILEVYGIVGDDALGSLAYAPPVEAMSSGERLWIVGPVVGGALAVPRVFYGSADAVKERTFLGFNPSDSWDTATAATSVTFDLDGTPRTMPTVLTRDAAGLMNGFQTGWLHFLCFE